MAELVLVRHAQASFGSDDYDRLSELGWQQARWLGEYFRSLGAGFDRVVIGAQRRHRETAQGIAETLGLDREPEIVPGLNEYDFHAVVDGFLAGREMPATAHTDRREHFRLLRDALTAWSRDEIAAPLPERWRDFERRVGGVLARLGAGRDGERVLVVSSGGPISMTLRHVLDLTPQVTIRLNLQMRNTGYSRCIASGEALFLSLFNATPHLEAPGRTHAVTYS